MDIEYSGSEGAFSPENAHLQTGHVLAGTFWPALPLGQSICMALISSKSLQACQCRENCCANAQTYFA